MGADETQLANGTATTTSATGDLIGERGLAEDVYLSLPQPSRKLGAEAVAMHLGRFGQPRRGCFPHELGNEEPEDPARPVSVVSSHHHVSSDDNASESCESCQVCDRAQRLAWTSRTELSRTSVKA